MCTAKLVRAALTFSKRGEAVRKVPRKFEVEVVAVAVGTIITNRPSHRSVRARLRIRLPPRMTGVKTLA
jgi:hypothetical protein